MPNGEPIVTGRSDGVLEILQGEKAALRIEPQHLLKFKRDLIRAVEYCRRCAGTRKGTRKEQV